MKVVLKIEDGKKMIEDIQTKKCDTRLWFSSDLHLSHANIIKYCKRPFSSAEEMNEGLISRWNECVHPKDHAYLLGDIAFDKNVDKVCHMLSRMNGTKTLIAGNHDKKIRKNEHFQKMFDGIHEVLEIDIADEVSGHGQKIVLCHYAMKVWNKSHHGAWQLYGHSHGSLPDDPNSLSMDVGVDTHDFRPWSYEEIRAVMLKKAFKPIDRHSNEVDNVRT